MRHTDDKCSTRGVSHAHRQTDTHTHARHVEVGCTPHISSYLGRAEYIPKMHW